MTNEQRPGRELLSAEQRARVLEGRSLTPKPLTREELILRQEEGARTLAAMFGESKKSDDVSQRFAITRGVKR